MMENIDRVVVKYSVRYSGQLRGPALITIAHHCYVRAAPTPGRVCMRKIYTGIQYVRKGDRLRTRPLYALCIYCSLLYWKIKEIASMVIDDSHLRSLQCICNSISGEKKPSPRCLFERRYAVKSYETEETSSSSSYDPKRVIKCSLCLKYTLKDILLDLYVKPNLVRFLKYYFIYVQAAFIFFQAWPWYYLHGVEFQTSKVSKWVSRVCERLFKRSICAMKRLTGKSLACQGRNLDIFVADDENTKSRYIWYFKRRCLMFACKKYGDTE